MIGDMEGYGVVPGHNLPPTPQPNQRRRRRTEPFLRGPIPMAWLARAAGLSKPALPAGLGLWFMRGVSKTSGPIRVSSAVRRKIGLSARQMLRGLHALEKGGLVQIVRGGRGRCPVVQVLGMPRSDANHQHPSPSTVGRHPDHPGLDGGPARDQLQVVPNENGPGV